ncbi:FixH family protein [Planococcus sp. CAU13]|uniref:FixH family protein n=1 Tax=Planococcus sp. CAU13 TaxID=1541197 RepID=UPI00052FF952|nr:FixH family protein [Planococcus sp. CAU13]
MKKIILMTLFSGLLLLAACGEENSDADAGRSAEIIETEFNSPETAEPGEAMIISVTVTQGNELVEDADEVVYEVWQSGHRVEAEMLTAEHIGDGVYESEVEFDEEGLYFVQAHTTARSLHVMPKQEIIVGNPDPESIIPDDSDDSDSNVDMDGHGH